MAGVIYYDYENEAGVAMAANLMHVDRDVLAEIPGYYRIDAEVSIKEVRELLAGLRQDLGQMVVLFTHAETLSEVCQNILLKSVEEDSEADFIFVSSKRLIPTLESRCNIFRADRLTREAFGIKNGITDERIKACTYAYCFGRQETYEALDGNEREMIDVVSKEDVNMLFNNKAKLLDMFGLLKEKDPMNYFDRYRDHYPGLLNMLEERLLFEDVFLPVIDQVHTHRIRYNKNARIYSKNDFFQLVISL